MSYMLLPGWPNMKLADSRCRGYLRMEITPGRMPARGVFSAVRLL